jgi:hypothetical protein
MTPIKFTLEIQPDAKTEFRPGFDETALRADIEAFGSKLIAFYTSGPVPLVTVKPQEDSRK